MYESYYISIRRDPLTTTVNISCFLALHILQSLSSLISS